MNHTQLEVSAQPRGALGQAHSILATSFQSVSSDFCGYSQRAAKRQGKQAQRSSHSDHNRASTQALEEPSCNITQPSADARRSHGLPQVLLEVHGDSTSQGIWKHLKLPTRRPCAPTARSHTGSQGISKCPMDAAGQSAAWPGRGSSPRGCQMPRESAPQHPPSPTNWPSVKPRRSGVSSSDCMVPKQSPPAADAVTDGGELGDCLYPGFWTNSCKALEHSQCSSTAAPVAFG